MHLFAIIVGPEVGLGHHVLFGLGGGSSINPAALAATVVAIVLMFVLPRKHVLVPLIVLSMLSPAGQNFVIGSFHFQIYRILLMFAWVRLLWQRYILEGSSSKIKINAVDKTVILYSISIVVCYTLLWKESAAFFNEAGRAYNVLGFYFVFRFFIRNREDVERTIKTLVFAALLIAALMVNEQVTGHNILGILGGVPEHTAIRHGYLRSQGPFSVYITAGAFGATLLPLVLCLWRKGESRVMASLGIVAALTITVTSRTSTAMVACMAAVFGMGMWYLRDKMRLVRRGIVVTLLALELVMKAPVWGLLVKVDIVGGSTGWQRYKIVDNFVRHFWDWWLVGSNNYWTWSGGDDMWDLANQYIATGETTGLLSLVFFIAMIVYCFKYLGNARKSADTSLREQWFLWLMGVALFSNLVAFMGTAYFDQTSIYWYALLAMIVGAAAPDGNPRTVPAAVKIPQRKLAGWHVQPEAQPQASSGVNSGWN